MRKFWKKQVEDLGGDPSVLMKGRTQLAKEMVIALVTAHRGAITMRNAGYVIGRAACIVKNPCVEFWQGVKDGLAIYGAGSVLCGLGLDGQHCIGTDMEETVHEVPVLLVDV